MPTGAATALLGAPMLLVLLPRLRGGGVWRMDPPLVVERAAHPGRLLGTGLVALLRAVWAALAFSYGPNGWT